MTDSPFVAYSEIHCPPAGHAELETAFRDRLGRVDAWPGFLRLEVWADEAGGDDAYVMVSWWESRQAFVDYMRSQDHRDSHERIPDAADAKPARFRRFTVVAT